MYGRAGGQNLLFAAQERVRILPVSDAGNLRRFLQHRNCSMSTLYHCHFRLPLTLAQSSPRFKTLPSANLRRSLPLGIALQRNLSLNIPLWLKGNTRPNFCTDFLIIWSSQGLSVPVYTLQFDLSGELSLSHRDKLVWPETPNTTHLPPPYFLFAYSLYASIVPLIFRQFPFSPFPVRDI